MIHVSRFHLQSINAFLQLQSQARVSALTRMNSIEIRRPTDTNGCPLLSHLICGSCMPVFLLRTIGQHLSIADTFHLNRAVSQCLLVYNILIPPLCVDRLESRFTAYKDKLVSQIAHILRVLKHCIDKLRANTLTFTRGAIVLNGRAASITIPTALVIPGGGTLNIDTT